MDQRTAVAIGKFDGLHRGHQALLKKLAEQGERGMKPLVVVVAVPVSGKLLTESEFQKKLSAFGISDFIMLPFCEEIRGMEPERFVREILVGRLHAGYVAVGRDFRYGYKRAGNSRTLALAGERFGFHVDILEKETDHGREIGSTWIRGELDSGNMEMVNQLLGYPFFVDGTVVSGNRIGRTLGMPTINLLPGEEKLLPPNGVYMSRTWYRGKSYAGVTNIGVKPTIHQSDPRRGVETHLLSFEEEIYGEQVCVELLSHSRIERKFSGLEELKAQIVSDVSDAKKFFE